MPNSFHKKGTASSRSTSTPRLASWSISPANGGEQGRVVVVQVPLEGVEGRPYHLAAVRPCHVRAPDEGVAAALGEDGAQVGGVAVGQGAVVEHPVEVLEVRVSGLGPLRPVVVVGGMVEDEIDDEGDPLRAQRLGKPLQVVHATHG